MTGAEIVSWDEILDKDVKSVDHQDLGKVESISQNYIQTKEGLVSKKYYFIPKYYVSGFDGKHTWVSLTKDEVKSKFEREKEPDTTEIETQEYSKRREEMRAKYPDFEHNIPQYDSAMPTKTTGTSSDKIMMPWDKIVGKNVKSNDDKDLGEIKSISPDYVEVEEGSISKKHYFIPKYYIESIDKDDNIHIAFTKDEVKERYQKDAPPTESELKTQEYLERINTVEANYPQFVHGVPFMAKEPETEVPVDYSGTTYDISWDKIIHKGVRASDNVDIGNVERVGNEFVVVREGTADAHIYYVPKTYIRDFDGSQLWIDAPSGLVRPKFEMDKEPTVEEIRSLAREAPRFKRAKTTASTG
ncbi:MAG TPA: hypothetical protein VJ695_11555 [Nitrososphaera sp.]|nr:hypothetical protein [Nitrososphaera sp.]